MKNQTKPKHPLSDINPGGLIMVNPWMAIPSDEAEANVKAAQDAGDMEVIALSYETIAAAPDLFKELDAILAALEAGETVTIEPGSVKAHAIGTAVGKANGTVTTLTQLNKTK